MYELKLISNSAPSHKTRVKDPYKAEMAKESIRKIGVKISIKEQVPVRSGRLLNDKCKIKELVWIYREASRYWSLVTKEVMRQIPIMNKDQ